MEVVVRLDSEGLDSEGLDSDLKARRREAQ